MGTFGNSSIAGISWNWFEPGATELPKNINRFTLTEAGYITKLSAYLENISTGHQACQVKGIIFDVLGEPNNLVGVSLATDIADNLSPAWVDLTFSPAVYLAAADYYLGTFCDLNADGLAQAYQASGGIYRGDFVDALGFADGPDTPWDTAGDGHDTITLCIYATYQLTDPAVGWTGLTVYHTAV